METADEIISAMRAIAPPGQASLDDATLTELRHWTAALLRVKPDADAEYARFRQITERENPAQPAELGSWLADKAVLVVGGTGCIGSALIRELRAHQPSRIASISRGEHTWVSQDRVDYRRVDIRDGQALKDLVADIRPDVVFHLAGQRDPGLAERSVYDTVTTNILGTRNVVAAAAAAGAQQVVHASTGKAMRPYSREVYAASKRLAEFVVYQARSDFARASMARFTHIVDNSLVHKRLLACHSERFFRLHEPGVVFYAQSARESAQLLLQAGLTPAADDLYVHAIRDLGWPISLLDLAIGTLRQIGSSVPIYFSGFDKGYEDTVRPDLFDPRSAGDVSPLFNKFEAARAEPSSAGTDRFDVRFDLSRNLDYAISGLAAACQSTGDTYALRAALDVASLALRDAAR
ncbi:MAG: polysaccharide biosynthesis protein [Streptosporangiaceae bacterium]